MKEKLKELFKRTPYGVKVKAIGWDESIDEEVEIEAEVESVNTDGYLYLKGDDSGYQYHIDDVELVLRNIDDLTDKEKKELLVALFGKKKSSDFVVGEGGVIQWIDKTNGEKGFYVEYVTFDPMMCKIYTEFLLEHHIKF